MIPISKIEKRNMYLPNLTIKFSKTRLDNILENSKWSQHFNLQITLQNKHSIRT